MGVDQQVLVGRLLGEVGGGYLDVILIAPVVILFGKPPVLEMNEMPGDLGAPCWRRSARPFTARASTTDDFGRNPKTEGTGSANRRTHASMTFSSQSS